MSEKVQAMFSDIADRYDRANGVLSLGMHHRWRRTAVLRSGAAPGMHVLDCATGTGDLALAFKRAVRAEGRVIGTDLNAEMLAHAPGKATAKGLDVQFHEADVEALPFPDRAFDICGMAFGIRNVDHPVQALREMARVVKGAGRVVILEFGQPGGLFGAAYRFYSRHVMPPLGKLITGYRQPYEYLPETAAAFPAGLRFLELMDAAGAFSSRLAEPLTGGAVWLYIGVVA